MQTYEEIATRVMGTYRAIRMNDPETQGTQALQAIDNALYELRRYRTTDDGGGVPHRRVGPSQAGARGSPYVAKAALATSPNWTQTRDTQRSLTDPHARRTGIVTDAVTGYMRHASTQTSQAQRSA
jgi:hypothetical protein